MPPRPSTWSPSPARTRFHGDAFEFIRDYHFNARNFFAPTRDSLNRNQFGGTLGGPLLQEQAVLLRRLPGQDREEQSAGDGQLRADRGDAGRRLHGDRVARRAAAGRSRCRPAAGFVEQHDQPVRIQPDRAEVPPARAGLDRSVRPPAVRHPEQQHRAPDAGQRRLHAEHRARRCSRRYIYAVYDNPATYDGKNVLTLSRTGQNNQVHSLVAGHNWCCRRRWSTRFT